LLKLLLEVGKMERSSDIKALIDRWCSAKPNRTHQVLAKKSGIKYNSLDKTIMVKAMSGGIVDVSEAFQVIAKTTAAE
jgi:hypothetical protein